MRSPQRFVACSLFALLSQVAVAHAQPAPRAPFKRAAPARENRDQNLVFDDDLLSADLSTPFGDPVFSGHLRPGRVMLIRPRTSFVPELYKSVEHI
jgi:hypothetical protein